MAMYNLMSADWIVGTVALGWRVPVWCSRHGIRGSASLRSLGERAHADRRGREAQGERAGEGRARIPGDQAAVRIHEGAIPRIGEEYGAAENAVRAVEPLDGSKKTDDGDGMNPSAMSGIGLPRTKSRPIWPEIGRNLMEIDGWSSFDVPADLSSLLRRRCSDLP